MGIDQAGRQHDAAPAPYQGALGQTRTETVQVWVPDGSMRAHSVYVAIDAAHDPALAAIARGGTLHHLGDGVDLAIAFIYHDPTLPLFVLVVPEVLRHEALRLRAELMQRLAADRTHAVPEYVRDVELVLGAHGLCARIAAGPKILASLGDAALEASWAALSERERELSLREELLVAREQALHARARVSGAVLDSELQEVDAAVFGEATLAELVDDDADEEAFVEEDDAFEEVEDTDESDIEDLDDEALDEGAEPSERGQVLVEAIAVEQAFMVDDPPTVTAALPAFEGADELALPEPPLGFVDGTLGELCVVAEGSVAWLFVRGRPAPPRDRDDLELLVQLDPEASVPVVLLVLVFDVSGSPEVRRGVVDLDDASQRRALEDLAQAFEVRLIAYEGAGELVHWAVLRGPRASNVAEIRRRVGDASLDRSRWEDARRAVLAAPPPWRDEGHPYQALREDVRARTATEAAVGLDEISEWSTPERLERAQLLFSVPDELLDAHRRARIADALSWGLPLGAPLQQVALALDLAKDRRHLLALRIEGLCRTSREPDHGGLEASVLRALWSEAVEEAAEHGLALSDEAEALLAKHVGQRALQHAQALAEGHDESLEPLRRALEGAAPTREALDGLMKRGAFDDILLVARALAAQPEDVVALSFAELARRSDPASLDALRHLLVHAEATPVRAGAALALAARRGEASEAIDDLARAVARGADGQWPLFAAALGRFGAGSYRTIARALEVQELDAERAAHVCAQLALHGARGQILAKARSHEPREARIAERAPAPKALRGKGD
jgi:hypothetical protein